LVDEEGEENEEDDEGEDEDDEDAEEEAEDDSPMSSRVKPPAKGLADSLYALVENGKLDALRRAAPPTFDWKAPGRDGLPPLHRVVTGYVTSMVSDDDAVLLASWLISQGADPSIPAPDDCKLLAQAVMFDEGTKGLDASEISFSYREETAITLALKWKQEILRKAAEPDSAWKEPAAEIEEGLDRLLDAFTAEPLAEAKREVHAIDSTVVQLWEDVLSDDASHDLTFECKGGKQVGAHALVVTCACRHVGSLEGLGARGSLAQRRPCLVCSASSHCQVSHVSPVLRAMLGPAFREGQQRKIEVFDTPEAAVRLFLELLYTGGSTADPLVVPVALSAIELAHRWQAEGAVGMLERALVPLLTAETFAPIANEAALKELRLLSSSCITFAREEDLAVDEMVKNGDLSAATLRLIGRSVSAARHEQVDGGKKRRRSF
jgi:hypothetical protein